jgi:hypothetical protein
MKNEEDPMTLRHPPDAFECFVCRDRIDMANPYPQLCTVHRVDASAALRQLEDDADVLNDAVTPALIAPHEERFMTMLTAASELELPGIHYVKTKRIAEFLKRIEATVAKDDAFAHVVRTWWNARQTKVDAEKLALQLAWAPVSVEIRAEKKR